MTAENKRNRTERIIDMSSALAYVFLGHALVSRRHLADVARSSSKHQSGAEEAVIEIDWRLELAKTLASQGSRQVNILSIASLGAPLGAGEKDYLMMARQHWKDKWLENKWMRGARGKKLS